MLGNTKSPAALVTAGVDLVPRASLISVTDAPGITPPCASLTVPDTAPVTPWADAGVTAMTPISHMARHRKKAPGRPRRVRRQAGTVDRYTDISSSEGCI